METLTRIVEFVLVPAGIRKTDVIMGLRDVSTSEATIKMIDLVKVRQLAEA